MIRLESLHHGDRIDGIIGESVEIIQVTWSYDLATVTYRMASGRTDEAVLSADDEALLSYTHLPGETPLLPDAQGWKIGVEALRLKHAALIDPMLAVSSSSLQPLPHQIKAVYGEFLPRTPLRYLLADDPGAGKTIMCGLYVKEMMLRGDVTRCLIVVPGSLAEQWAQELWEKFGLNFTVLNRDLIATAVSGSVFNDHPLLIARMDMLSRDDDLLEKLEASDWDLIAVDEAHRMSAEGTTSESKKTKRYELGQVLGGATRNFLLMTATPHSGDPNRFQAFLALLDRDRFGSHRVAETARPGTDLMRRMLKEELLTMDGKPLFPERRAQTIPYLLETGESELYEEVTTYVRDEMNRAEALRKGQRRTVGFAMMVLQRRLASSPESILQSLRRRHAKLTEMRPEVAAGISRADMEAQTVLPDDESRPLAALEEQEHSLVLDGATAAQTLAELDAEIASLARLVSIAERVRHAGNDSKWTELRTLLDHPAAVRSDGTRRKLIVFTEFRDTLQYLRDRIAGLPGWRGQVVEIHGGMPRQARLAAQRTFTGDKEASVLLATDAAGEGLNLQAASLMVNYDLPWNPNRLEQRFGRIHRIGQTEVCHLWNLVATDTLEGHVYLRLLTKMEEQSQSLQGKVFDVLGEAFAVNTSLGDLLTQAIRHGEDPEVQAYLDTVINDTINNDLPELVRQRAQYADVLQQVDLDHARRRADEGAVDAIQPHYSGPWFQAALPSIGGGIRPRSITKHDVTSVPSAVREHAQRLGTSLLSTYRGVSLGRLNAEAEADQTVGPGHPLFDAVAAVTVEQNAGALHNVAVLIDPTGETANPRVFAAGSHEITDGTAGATTLSREFVFVEITDSQAKRVGATYLDYRAPAADEHLLLAPLLENFGGLDEARRIAEEWANRTLLQDHRQTVAASHGAAMERRRAEVVESLTQEAHYWDRAAINGGRGSVSPDGARRRAAHARERLKSRTAAFPAEERIVTRRPQVHAVAIVVPASALGGEPVAQTSVAQAGLLAGLPSVGYVVEAGTHNLLVVDAGDVRQRWLPIQEAPDDIVNIRRTAVIAGLNLANQFRLLLVARNGGMRILADPFERTRVDEFNAHEFRFSWSDLWRRADQLR